MPIDNVNIRSTYITFSLSEENKFRCTTVVPDHHSWVLHQLNFSSGEFIPCADINIEVGYAMIFNASFAAFNAFGGLRNPIKAGQGESILIYIDNISKIIVEPVVFHLHYDYTVGYG